MYVYIYSTWLTSVNTDVAVKKKKWFKAALRACSAVCHAVDAVVSGQVYSLY
jgi:hypothetical protein